MAEQGAGNVADRVGGDGNGGAARGKNVPLPKAFDGLAESWPRWKARFERYSVCVGLARQPDREQVSMFLYSMGEIADDLLVTMNVNERTITFAELVEKFDGHFGARKNTITARAKFNKRYQRTGEKIDSFIQDLHRLADDCEYEGLKDQLIRDRIVAGVSDDDLSDKLQSLADLTLDVAIRQARQAESRKEEQEILRGKATVNAIKSRNKTFPPKSKPHSPPRPHRHPKSKPKTPHKKHGPQRSDKCGNCGKGPHKRPEDCPARYEECFRCKVKGHYSFFCPDKKGKARAVHEVGEYSEESDEFFMGTLDSVEDEFWSATVEVDGKETKFKLDTGAAVTAVDRSVVGNAPLQPATRRLTGPGNKPIEVVGCFESELRYRERKIKETIFVIENQKTPLLSRSACEKLQLVKRLDAVDAKTVKAEFPDQWKGLGSTKKPARIQLRDDAKPTSVYTARKVPQPLLKTVKEEIEKMKKEGVISPVTEPTDWCSPMVVVPKPKGGVRLCIDLTSLNKAVKREAYPMASVDESLAKLSGSKVFSKLDARSGYWQIPLDEQSRLLTTFITPFGRFCMNRLPFGICSASEIFQRMMTETLEGLEGIVCHQDDVLIHAPDDAAHDQIVRAAMARIKDAGLTLNEKCEFSQKSVKFLGHIIDADGIRPDPEKVEAITHYPAPTNITELQRFFGMVNFLGKFIPGMAHKTEPLRQLLRKDVTWTWDTQQETAFQEVKNLLSSDTALAHYSPHHKTWVAADASNAGIGAVLMQEQDGKRRPVVFASRSLTEAEKNYAVIEKEALAATWAVERFSQFLLGMDFIIETDHKPLIPLLSSKEIACMPPRIQRFRLRLMRFSPTVEYVPGKQQVTADALSRAPVGTPTKSDVDFVGETAEMERQAIGALPASTGKLESVRLAQRNDPVLCDVREYINRGWPAYLPSNPIMQPYWQDRHRLTIVGDLLLYDDRLVIPQSMRMEMLERLHEGHLGITKCRGLATSSMWWPGIGAAIGEMVSRCTACAKHRPVCLEPLLPSEFPKRPWERLAMDLFEFDGQTFLLVVDYYSRWIEVKHMPTQTSKRVIRRLKAIMSIHGIPEVVVSDNGPQFASEEFSQFARAYGFTLVTSSPRYPQSNGMAERAVQTVKRLWKKAKDPYLALLLYRNSPLQNGYSPAQLLMSRRLNTRLPTPPSALEPAIPDHAAVRASETASKEMQRQNFNKRHAARLAPKFQPGDHVHIRDLDRPGLIVERHASPRSYLVKTEQGTFRRNNRHLAATPAETENPTATSAMTTPARPSTPKTALTTPGNATATSSAAPSSSQPVSVSVPRRSGRVIIKPTKLDL